MSKVPLQLNADAMFWRCPEEAGSDVGAQAGFCITPVLPDAHLHGRGEGSAVGQGERSGGFKTHPQAGDRVIPQTEQTHLLDVHVQKEGISGGGEAEPVAAPV